MSEGLPSSWEHLSGGNRFCTKCGTQIPPGADFCPNCGTSAFTFSAGQGGASGPSGPYPYSGRRHEKQEKQEKQEKNEKGRGGDLTGAITGGLILIWLGLTFYLQENGYIASDNWWAYFLIGLGAILILQGVFRYATRRRPPVGSVIGGVFLILIGLAFIQGFSASLWPLILVAIGVAILLSALIGRQRRPVP
jgi:hypothetical protein